MTSKVTVIYLLYNAEKNVERLYQLATSQKHPNFKKTEDWLQIHFNDDHSKDNTELKFQTIHQKNGSPSYVHYFRSAQNLGLAASINASMGRVKSEFVLTCHLDAFFDDDYYVYKLLALMELYPEFGAITGSPILPKGKLKFIEKLTTVFNLMDVMPTESKLEYEAVGFAEGRCDLFRVQALAKTGFYDQSFRVAGEDLALAGKLREAGYEIVKSNTAKYELTLSSEQDSIFKFIKHTWLFGYVAPRIFARSRMAVKSVAGVQAGENRRTRSFLRALHLLSTAVIPVTLFGLTVGILIPMPKVLTFVLTYESILYLIKLKVFFGHSRKAKMPLLVLLGIIPFHRILDVAYSLGILTGIYSLLHEKK